MFFWRTGYRCQCFGKGGMEVNLESLVHAWQGKFKTCDEARRVIRFAYKDDRSDLLRAYIDDETLDQTKLEEALHELNIATSDYFERVALTQLQAVLNQYADLIEAMLLKRICETIIKKECKK